MPSVAGLSPGFTLLRAKKLAGIPFEEAGGVVGGGVVPVETELDPPPPQPIRLHKRVSNRERSIR
jgi:hypothetical protein